MTNMQLCLVTGLPMLTIILSWVSNSSRHDATHRRIAELEGRMVTQFGDLERRMETKFSEMERRFETRFSELERRFEKQFGELLAAVHQDALEILRNMSHLQERVGVVEDRQGRS